MEIREVGPEDYERAAYIGRQAFAHGRRGGAAGWTTRTVRRSPSLGAYDEGGMQARVSIIHYQVHLGADVVVPMGGIGGVSCLPASRGKGYVGALLDATLERMRDRAGDLSPVSVQLGVLSPLRVGVGRHDAAIQRTDAHSQSRAGKRKKYAPPRLPTAPKSRSAIREFARRYRGMLARDEKKWNDILKDTDEYFTFTYLYEHEGKTEGYLSFRGGTGTRHVSQ